MEVVGRTGPHILPLNGWIESAVASPSSRVRGRFGSPIRVSFPAVRLRPRTDSYAASQWLRKNK